MYFILQWCDIINKYCKKRKRYKNNKVNPITEENKENKENKENQENQEYKENNSYEKNIKSDIVFKFKDSVEPLNGNVEPLNGNVEPVNQLDIDNSIMLYRKNRPPPINIKIKSNS